MLMPHRRRHAQLHIDQHGQHDRPAQQPGRMPAPPRAARGKSPARGHNDHHQQPDVGLCQHPVENPDLVHDHRHAQAAEHTLHDDRAHGDIPEDAHPAARLAEPQHHREDHREQAHPGRDQPVSMLVEILRPARDREEERCIRRSSASPEPSCPPPSTSPAPAEQKENAASAVSTAKPNTSARPVP